MDEGLIGPNEKPVNGIFYFRNDLAPNPQQHQHRDQRHPEHRSEEHRESLGERQWPEQPAFDRRQREDRHETDGDDQQGKEERTPYAFGGSNDNIDSFAVGRFALVGLAKMFELLVRIFDHDDRRIHHGADGDGDAAQGHDIGGQMESKHGQEGNDNGNGQGDDRH